MKFCDDCKHLSLTENEQQVLRNAQKRTGKYQGAPLFHICTLLDERIFHNGKHPLLPRSENCPLDK